MASFPSVNFHRILLNAVRNTQARKL